LAADRERDARTGPVTRVSVPENLFAKKTKKAPVQISLAWQGRFLFDRLWDPLSLVSNVKGFFPSEVKRPEREDEIDDDRKKRRVGLNGVQKEVEETQQYIRKNNR
jgi:hypothetical protein